MRKFLILAVVLVVAGLAGYFGYFNKQMAQITPSEETSPEGEEELPPVEVSEVFKEPVTYGELKQSYSGQGFSFKYSDGFKVSSSEVEDGQMVTIENEKGSGFQLFIISFDESGMVMPQRIQQDLPDIVIKDPKNAQLDGTATIVFNSYNDDFGDTFEAWVNHKGKLYQISGPRTAEQLIAETLETWDWR